MKGNPRLYIEHLTRGRIRVSVSNSENSIGWRTRVDAIDMVEHGLLTLDKTATARCREGIKVYGLSKKGCEAITQYEAEAEYKRVLRREMPKFLRSRRGQLRKHVL